MADRIEGVDAYGDRWEAKRGVEIVGAKGAASVVGLTDDDAATSAYLTREDAIRLGTFLLEAGGVGAPTNEQLAAEAAAYANRVTGEAPTPHDVDDPLDTMRDPTDEPTTWGAIALAYVAGARRVR